MDCPNCGLVNPETAQRCDCGYDFAANVVKESYPNLSSKSPSQVTKEGRILIVPRRSLLPPYCVKCGVPTNTGRSKKTFSWHPPWVIVFIFLGLLPYFIAAAVTTKKMEVALPLCAIHQKRRKKLLYVGLGLLGLCVPVALSVGSVVGGPDGLSWALLVGVLVLIAAHVVSFPMRSVLRPVRIDDSGGRFEKAGGAYLSLIHTCDQGVDSTADVTPAEPKPELPAPAVVKEKADLLASTCIPASFVFCSHCRTPNPSDALYCGKCGRETHRGDEPALAPGTPATRADDFRWVTTPSKGVTFGAIGPSHRPTPEVGDHPAAPVVEGSPSIVSPTSTPGPLYATMGQRFIAYLADLVVVYLIVFAVYVAVGAFHISLPNDESLSFYAIFYPCLFAYMIVAQSAYHTTVGKYVTGLEVRSESQNQMYPSFWRVLLRETIGRVVASLLWGAGYWTAIRKPKKQAWSDALARTVVTVRGKNRVLARALTAFVAVAFVLDVGIIGYGLYKEDRDKRIAAFSKEIESATTDVLSAREAVNKKLSDASPVNDWDSFLVYQSQMKSLKNDLDRYEAQINRMQGLLQRAISGDLAASEGERNQYVVLRQVYDLRKRQAEKLRREADLVIGYDGKAGSMGSLRTDLQFLDSDIEGLEHQAAQLLERIGVK